MLLLDILTITRGEQRCPAAYLTPVKLPSVKKAQRWSARRPFSRTGRVHRLNSLSSPQDRIGRANPFPSEEEIARELRALDRFRGALIGGYVGDALGGLFDEYRPEGYRESLVRRVVRGSTGMGPLPASDGSRLTGTLGESLALYGRFDGWDVAQRLVDEYENLRTTRSPGANPSLDAFLSLMRGALAEDEMAARRAKRAERRPRPPSPDNSNQGGVVVTNPSGPSFPNYDFPIELQPVTYTQPAKASPFRPQPPPRGQYHSAYWDDRPPPVDREPPRGWEMPAMAAQDTGLSDIAAALRIAPTALLLYNSSSESPPSSPLLSRLALDTAQLTHKSPDAIAAAILQAHSISACLSYVPSKTESPSSRLWSALSTALVDIHKMPGGYETGDTTDRKIAALRDVMDARWPWQRAAGRVRGVLDDTQGDVGEDHWGMPLKRRGVINEVVAAVWAVQRGMRRDQSFRETLLSAVAIGGSPYAVAGLAGAMYGAYRGLSNIPESWVDAVDVSSRVRLDRVATDLYAPHSTMSAGELMRYDNDRRIYNAYLS